VNALVEILSSAGADRMGRLSDDCSTRAALCFGGSQQLGRARQEKITWGKIVERDHTAPEGWTRHVQ
jgi:hypothetical protein